MGTGDEPRDEPRRTSFQERLEMTWLSSDRPDLPVQRFISCQPAWKPGEGMSGSILNGEPDASGRRTFGPGAFGGHVYAQAPLAAARVVEREDRDKPIRERRGIHSIQGVFSNPSQTDRPFIYDVSNIFSSRSFSTRLVTARHTSEPSSNPRGPFPLSDAQLPPGNIAFTCLATFKRPVIGPAEHQEEASPQKRFADILASRAPEEWDPSPQADIDFVRETDTTKGHGTFPILDMYKVDMTAFNADKAVPERRQLILYRPYKPLPQDDPNAHIVCHAFEADRNGLIMLGNHLGYGYNMGPVASLSYSFYVHVNPADAMMEGDGWWVQEIWWPRISAGRGMQETKLWSPKGVHVASGYQDGIILPAKTEKAKI